MTINMAQLKAFVSVATVGSFTKAARVLNLSQSNLSMQVATLERSYDVKLLERKRGHVQPTPMGKDLVEIAQQIFALQSEAASLVKNANDFEKGILRIGSDSPVTVFPYIAAYKKQYPNVALSLFLGSSEEVFGALKACKVDVGIMSELDYGDHYIGRAIRRSGLGCLFLRDHPLANHDRITFQDLAGQGLIMRLSGSQTRAVFDAARKMASFDADIALEVSSREGVCEAVLNGLGVGIIWHKEFNGDPRIKVVPLDVEGGFLTACLVTSKEREGGGVLRSFVRMIEHDSDC